ncbi:MAG: sigma-70 family RNA polymerase sigma factor [Bacteroidetes bacterium]|nr:sigma-70 family RNA polymerase sigma factor [Bacteroidota bacterium]
MKEAYSETGLINGIRNHDSAILEYVYDAYFPMIEGFVIHNSGSRDEAQDVFQEAMLIAYKKIREGELELTCRFGTYLYAICKKVWIQDRRKYLLHAEKLRQQPLMVNDPGLEEDPLLQQHLKEIFDKHFRELSKDCQKILSMFFTNHTVDEIRDEMNYKDLHHAADRKYRCKKSLIKRMMSDPLFKTLKDEVR